MHTVDAVVVGGGHNGLVAAANLADAGWEVELLEATDHLGGAVHSVEDDGFVVDRFSSYYPLAAASPVISALDLTGHGLRWSRAPVVLAHPVEDGRAALLHPEPADTAAGLEAAHPGDGQAWLRMCQQWHQIGEGLLAALLTRWPPVAPSLALLRRLGAADALRLARFLTLPVTRMATERFGGQQPALLLAGNALHTDIAIDNALSGTFGWLLAMLGQQVGFPVPVGGSGRLAAALARRARSAGASLTTAAPVRQVLTDGSGTTGVQLADGTTVRARRAVLADVDAGLLYGTLLAEDTIPARLRRDLGRFERDNPTVKINYALNGPIPWRDPDLATAGTIHLGGGLDSLRRGGMALALGEVPGRPFVLVGQTTVADASRSPAGSHSVWAYAHLPVGVTDQADRLAEAMEAELERHAPGFAARILRRDVQSPRDLQNADASLVDGGIGGGTNQLHQQLVFRPTAGLGGASTVVPGLYLAGSSAHPGPGVHGGCGFLAARAALRHAGRLGKMHRRLTTGALELLYRPGIW